MDLSGMHERKESISVQSNTKMLCAIKITYKNVGEKQETVVVGNLKQLHRLTNLFKKDKLGLK